MLAPLVVFAYNRPEHIKIVLNTLKQCRLCENTDIYIFCDGAKNNKVKEEVEKVRDVVKNFSKSSNYKKTIVKLSDKNKGLADSIIQGVSEIIEKYGKVIVLEDDLVVSRDFLEYMNEGLDFYEENKNVWSLSGFSFSLKSLQNSNDNIFMTYRGTSWGWATWKDRWELTDWAVEDYKKFKRSLYSRYKFAKSGNDMPMMLDLQQLGKNSSWAIRWNYAQFKNKMYSVYPKYSKIKNIGTDGSGTHSGNTNKFDTQIIEGKYNFKNTLPQKRVLREFKKKSDLPLLYCIKEYYHNVIKKREILLRKNEDRKN